SPVPAERSSAQRSTPPRHTSRARAGGDGLQSAIDATDLPSRIISPLLQETRLPADNSSGIALGHARNKGLIVHRRKCRLKQLARIDCWHTPEGPSFPRMKGYRILQSIWHVLLRSGLIRMD